VSLLQFLQLQFGLADCSTGPGFQGRIHEISVDSIRTGDCEACRGSGGDSTHYDEPWQATVEVEQFILSGTLEAGGAPVTWCGELLMTILLSSPPSKRRILRGSGTERNA